VVADGAVWLNSEKVDLDKLDAALGAIGTTSAHEAVPVSLEADESVPNGTIVRVLDSLRRTGFTGVNLRTRE